MKVYVTKISKKNELDIEKFKYKGSELIVSMAMWYQLLEPRYVINKQAFKSLWFRYTNSSKEICNRKEEFDPSALIEYLTPWNVYYLECFLEKIWINFKFIITLV